VFSLLLTVFCALVLRSFSRLLGTFLVFCCTHLPPSPSALLAASSDGKCGSPRSVPHLTYDLVTRPPLPLPPSSPCPPLPLLPFVPGRPLRIRYCLRTARIGGTSDPLNRRGLGTILRRLRQRPSSLPRFCPLPQSCHFPFPSLSPLCGGSLVGWLPFIVPRISLAHEICRTTPDHSKRLRLPSPIHPLRLYPSSTDTLHFPIPYTIYPSLRHPFTIS